ncbi:MAG: hypothetical protein J6I86_01270 [Bacteroidaceae bacterium]|nr:hypothetical protein [Bacteroidaceae bacterium]
MKKKLFLILVLLCTCALGSQAETITYVKRTWDEANMKVVETTETMEAQNITEVFPRNASSFQSAQIGWHTLYVTGKVDLSNYSFLVTGNTTLILCDDADLTVHNLLMLGWANRLHIYGQAKDTGKLTVNPGKTICPFAECGIGQTSGSPGNVTDTDFEIHFHGGHIVSYGVDGGHGIGADVGFSGNNYYIYGGHVEGHGDEDGGVGIGGDTELINIYGGTVIGYGGDDAAGIGGNTSAYLEGGYLDGKGIFPYWVGGRVTKVKIYGGDVKGYGGKDAAGIGGNKYGAATVEIHGGKVWAEANSESNGAGIGGGRNGNGGSITITGGDVTAYGGKYAAGIGSGINGASNYSHGPLIKISGGIVHAYGGVDAAGIGGGEDANGGDITISGGTVYAESLGLDSNGAGIGAGEDANCESITITGGTIYAKGGRGTSGFALGSNLSNGKGTLKLAENLKVNAGKSASEIERRFTAFEREGACWYRKYVEITACDHTTPTRGSDKAVATSYTMYEDGHNQHCRYCYEVVQEPHSFPDDPQIGMVCSKCGKNYNEEDDTWTVSIYKADEEAGVYTTIMVYDVVKGKAFNMPELEELDGLKMLAMVKDPAEAPRTIWLTDAEIASQANFFDPEAEFIPTANTSIYPRYRYDFTPEWTWPIKADGDVDMENVKLSLANLCLDTLEITIPSSNITYKNDESNNDRIYSVTYSYEYPSGSGVNYTFTDVKHTVLYQPYMIIENNEKNNSTLSRYNGMTVEVTLKDRTFIHDGNWNTLCLPFSLSAEQLAEEDCPLHGATIKTLEDATVVSGTLTLTFTDNLTAIEAGKPYIVKWPQGTDETNPVFRDVTIDNDFKPIFTYKEGRPYAIIFYGTYSPTEISDEFSSMKGILYMGAASTLYYPSAAMTIGSCRAYFILSGITAGDLDENGVKAFVLNYGDDATGIQAVNSKSSNGKCYDLSGRQIVNSKSSNGKLPQGIYIRDGRKVVIK